MISKDWNESAVGNVNVGPETDVLLLNGVSGGGAETGSGGHHLEPPPTPDPSSRPRRNRKDSFRIVTIVDTLRLSDAIIAEHDELAEEYGVQASIGNGSTRPEVGSCIRPRIGSVDSGFPGSRPHSRSTSVELRTNSAAAVASKMNSNAAWKQLNDGLNHLFPVQNKKSSLPKLLTTSGSQQQPQTLSRPELRKSSSRSSLCDDFELIQDLNEDQRYHTVTGSTNVSATVHGRKNTLVSLPSSRNTMLARPDEPDQQPHRPLSSSPSYPWTTMVEPRPAPGLVNGVRGRGQDHMAKTVTVWAGGVHNEQSDGDDHNADLKLPTYLVGELSYYNNPLPSSLYSFYTVAP